MLAISLAKAALKPSDAPAIRTYGPNLSLKLVEIGDMQLKLANENKKMMQKIYN
ncbi:MAG: hypothetical protein KAQ95_14185 [Candidatus Heimdallarchaeota archaeon]|nr:hypothetical protein [Candidatus Heimdallarchaeota archaeon]